MFPHFEQATEGLSGESIHDSSHLGLKCVMGFIMLVSASWGISSNGRALA